MINHEIFEIIERHGTKLYIMSQNDFDHFSKVLKEKYPSVYKYIKSNLNFNITPICLGGENDNK